MKESDLIARAASAMGRKGGRSKSPKKRRAARQNGLRNGGRPGRVCDGCGAAVRGWHKKAALDKTCTSRSWHWERRGGAV